MIKLKDQSPIIFPQDIIKHPKEMLWNQRFKANNTVYLIIISLFIIIIASLPIIKIDVTKNARGIIKSIENNNVITSYVSGQVLYENLKESGYVEKGDTLLILDAIEIEQQIRNLYTKLDDVLHFVEDLNQLTQLDTSYRFPKLSTSLYKKELLHFDQQFKDHQLKIQFLEGKHQKSQLLFAELIISEKEFQQSTYELHTTKLNFNTFFHRQLGIWENELTEQIKKQENLIAEIDRLEKELDHFVIRAPISGFIVQPSSLSPGNYINAHQKIASLSPDNQLVIETYINPSDIGLIKNGMPVNFQIDAFNYNHWGLASGQVINISKDIIAHKNSMAFYVQCSLNQKELKLKNGYAGKLKKGMTLTTRFILTKRSLLQLLYDQIDDWVNPNQV